MLHCFLKERGEAKLSDIFSGDLGGGIGVDTGEDMDIFVDDDGEDLLLKAFQACSVIMERPFRYRVPMLQPSEIGVLFCDQKPYHSSL